MRRRLEVVPWARQGCYAGVRVTLAIEPAPHGHPGGEEHRGREGGESTSGVDPGQQHAGEEESDGGAGHHPAYHHAGLEHAWHVPAEGVECWWRWVWGWWK